MMFKVSLIVFIAVEFTLFCSSSAQRRPPRNYNAELPETRKVLINRELSDDFESSKIPKDPDIDNNSGKVKNDFKDPEPISKPDDSASSGGRIVFPGPVSGGQVFDERFNETNFNRKQKKVKRKQRKQKQKRFERSVVEMSSEPEECGKCLDNRYLKHYFARDCVPVEAEYICRKSCPKYFRCPENVESDSIDECLYTGKSFRIGEDIPTPNPCLHCRCTEQSGRPTITCAESECFGDWFPLNETCYHQYVWEKCCSQDVCPPALDSVKTCLYEGKGYKIGEKIFPKEDNCVSCICDEHWNQSHPLNSQSCRVIDCDFELQTKWKNRTGCIPVYHENSCCPIDYHCPTPKEWKCVFDGRGYEIGAKLDTRSDCIDCVCRIPPDFTCMRKKCDSAPPEQNCTAVYETNKCCPKYQCPNDSISKEAETERRNVETEKRLLETERRIIETEKRLIETERRIVETEKRILFNIKT